MQIVAEFRQTYTGYCKKVVPNLKRVIGEIVVNPFDIEIAKEKCLNYCYLISNKRPRQAAGQNPTFITFLFRD